MGERWLLQARRVTLFDGFGGDGNLPHTDLLRVVVGDRPMGVWDV